MSAAQCLEFEGDCVIVDLKAGIQPCRLMRDISGATTAASTIGTRSGVTFVKCPSNAMPAPEPSPTLICPSSNGSPGRKNRRNANGTAPAGEENEHRH